MPKLYSEKDISRAIEMVENGTKTKNAAEICKIRRTTLIRRMKVHRRQRRGRKPLLSSSDESKISSYVVFMANAGIPVTHKRIRETAARLASHR